MKLARVSCGFSLFKKKCLPVQSRNYQTYSQLYEELSAFEGGLEELETKKMPKKLEDFGRKMRRLYRQDSANLFAVPLRVNHTYEFFVRCSDELLFGNQDQEKPTTLEQLLVLTRNMADLSLDGFNLECVPRVQNQPTLLEAIEQRFVNVEERLSRLLFKGYLGFSQATSKLSFLNQREYKGDFKFELVDDLDVLEKASECLLHCAQFNQLRSKLVIACEKAVSAKQEQLSDVTLARLLYCLAVAGRPLKML
jgi:hypothetical protein